VATANNVTLNIDSWGSPFLVCVGETYYCRDERENGDPGGNRTKTEAGWPLTYMVQISDDSEAPCHIISFL
jgi:hypothetical protein